VVAVLPDAQAHNFPESHLQQFTVHMALPGRLTRDDTIQWFHTYFFFHDGNSNQYKLLKRI
jgi:hypothetical protein